MQISILLPLNPEPGTVKFVSWWQKNLAHPAESPPSVKNFVDSLII
jgi:hypothetical protein